MRRIATGCSRKSSRTGTDRSPLFERFDGEIRRYITVIQTALFEFAEHDHVVLISRRGQWLLHGLAGCATSTRWILTDPVDPALYDLMINTDKLTVPTAVEMAGAVERPKLKTTEAGVQFVADRSLASRVQVGLATHPETLKYRITVEAEAGQGTAAMDEALEVARGVPGVHGIKAEQVEIPPISPFVA